MKQNLIPLVIILAIAVLIAGFFVLNPDAGRDLLVEIGLADPPADDYTASGFLEGEQYIVSSLSGGRIQEIFVEVGQLVGSGDQLMTFDTSEIDLQIMLAEEELVGLKAQLSLLVNTPSASDLAVLDRSIDLAEAGLTAVENALTDYEEIGLEDLDEINQALMQAAVDEAEAAVKQAEAEKALVENAVTEADLAQIKAAVSAKEIELAQLKARKENFTLYAPADGIAAEVLQKPGEFTQSGLPAIRLISFDQLELTVFIPEADLNWVYIGQEVSFSVDAYPDAKFTGHVSEINNSAEFTPRNVQTPEERTILVFEVTIMVPNPDGRLKPGLPADAVFEVQP